jgi:hypothetical protein
VPDKFRLLLHYADGSFQEGAISIGKSVRPAQFVRIPLTVNHEEIGEIKFRRSICYDGIWHYREEISAEVEEIIETP